MAGFSVQDGYWLPRSRVEPPPELVSQMWPWVDDVLTALNERFPGERPTTQTAFSFFRSLRRIVLQDAAAMMVLGGQGDESHSARLSHGLFELPLFQSQEFRLFVSIMRQKLIVEAAPSNDPNVRTLARIVPGVNRRFEDMTACLRQLQLATETDRAERERLQRALAGRVVAEVQEAKEFLALRQEVIQRNQQRIQQDVRYYGAFAEESVRLLRAVRTGVKRFLEESSDEALQESRAGLAEALASPSPSPQRGRRLIDGIHNNHARIAEFPDEQQQQQMVEATDAVAEEAEAVEEEQGEAGFAEEDNGEVDIDVNEVADAVPSFRHQNVKTLRMKDLYFEYFGLARFEGKPVNGGFHRLESQRKNKWRKGYDSGDAACFSRWKSLVFGLLDATGEDPGQWNEEMESTAVEWDEYIATGGLSGALNKLKKAGFIVSKRNKQKKQRISEESP